METRRAIPTWVRILEFVVALLVLVFLLAGPGGLDALGKRLRQYLYLQRQPTPTVSAPVPVKPAAARAAVAPQTQPAPPALAAKGTPPPAVTPPVTPGAVAQPRAQSAPTPARTPAVNQPSAAPVTPAVQRTPARRPTPRLRSRRPTPTPAPAAEVTPPSLTPPQYLAKLMREGHQLYQTGWYGPAMARFKEAARVSPGSASVHLWYGRAALRMGRTDEAREALQRVVALAPSSDAAREARALLERMSRPEER